MFQKDRVIWIIYEKRSSHMKGVVKMESPTGKALCDKCGSDRIQYSLEQLLYSAVEFNHYMSVEALLEEGADANW